MAAQLVDSQAHAFASFLGDDADSWMPSAEPHVPLPSSADHDQSILDELSLIESLTTPNPAPGQAPPAHPAVPTPPLVLGTPVYNHPAQHGQAMMSPVTPSCGLPLVSPLKRKAPFSSLTPSGKKPALLSNFGTATAAAKAEPMLVLEPLTPSASHRQLHTFGAAPMARPSCPPVPHSAQHPLSPLCDSACSDDEDSIGACRPSPESPLPAPSAFQAAKRRAARSRALKRSRARTAAKQESVLTEPASPADSVDAGHDDEDDAESGPIDKKVARAIRNRQAAQRSRVEAKLKMQTLADANDELACAVESLKEENAALNKQLQALLAHTFGHGQGVDDVLAVFSRIKESYNDAA